MKVQPPFALLHVAPVATYVENVHKRKRRHLLDVLLQRLASRARRQRRPALLPGVADTPLAEITHRLQRARGGGDGEPAFVLLDAERALVQAVGRLRLAVKVIALPEMSG